MPTRPGEEAGPETWGKAGGTKGRAETRVSNRTETDKMVPKPEREARSQEGDFKGRWSGVLAKSKQLIGTKSRMNVVGCSRNKFLLPKAAAGLAPGTIECLLRQEWILAGAHLALCLAVEERASEA